jgi:hypothetical protein
LPDVPAGLGSGEKVRGLGKHRAAMRAVQVRLTVWTL